MSIANAINNISPGLQYLNSNGVFSAIPGTTIQVLGGISSSLPAYTSYPQVVGLGLGASPGSTTGLTFNGSDFLANYIVGTYVPTYFGATTAGTTVYTTQVGYYTQIGKIVYINYLVSGTSATGTGSMRISIPFTSANLSNVQYVGTLLSRTAIVHVLPTTFSRITLNQAFITIASQGSGATAANLNSLAVAFNWSGSQKYQI